MTYLEENNYSFMCFNNVLSSTGYVQVYTLKGKELNLSEIKSLSVNLGKIKLIK